MMFIALEGVDGSGKTTIGRELAKTLGFRFVEKPLQYSFEENQLDRYQDIKKALHKNKNRNTQMWLYCMNALFASSFFENENCVIDRFFLSNPAWIIDEENKKILKLAANYIKKECLFIILNVDEKVLKQRIVDRDGIDSIDYRKIKDSKKVFKRIVRLAQSYKLNYRIVDVDDNLNGNINKILEIVKTISIVNKIMCYTRLIDLLKNSAFNNSSKILADKNYCCLNDLFLTSPSISSKLSNDDMVVLSDVNTSDFLYRLLYALTNHKPFVLNGHLDFGKVNIPKYVIGLLETTGSTGEKKLIGLDEKTLLSNLEAFFCKLPQINCAGLFTSYHYSYGFNCLLGSIINGISLEIADQSRLNDVDYFIEFLNGSDYQLVFCPVALLNYVSQNKLFAKIRKKNFSICFAGELSSFSKQFVSYCNDSNIKLINTYGLTETGILFCETVSNELVQNRFSKKRILAPYAVHESDSSKQDLMISINEVYDGFYDVLNNKCIFHSIESKKQPFSTHDVIEYVDSDCFRIADRSDNIVKINGLKISINRIENMIMGIEGIKDCAVYPLTKSSNNNVLVASIVTSSAVTREQIFDELKKEIPSAGIPIVKFVSEIPLNQNGKKDKNKLSLSDEIITLDPQTIICLINKAIDTKSDLDEDYANASLKQLGINSLDLVSLASMLEKEYKMDFDFVLVNSHRITLGEIITYIEGRSNG